MNIKDHDGGALIEFVFVLPILLLLVGGLVDFGILFYNKQVITNASREGARAGIVFEKDDTDNKIVLSESYVQAIVLNYCNNKIWNLGGNSLQVSATGVDFLSYPNDLTVSVSINDYELLLSPLLNLFGGNFGKLDLSAATVMGME